jgi:trehalose 6-phosphate synthase
MGEDSDGTEVTEVDRPPPQRTPAARDLLKPAGRARTASSNLVVVANRMPVRRVSHGETTTWQPSPGGLTSAITPLVQKNGGSWIGWPGSAGPAPDPFKHAGMSIVPVGLSKKEVEAFYNGFSNRTLWPLYHAALRPPEVNRKWWQPYVEVNQRYAQAALRRVRDGDLVWVHDYHLQLVPLMLRERKPSARIGFFLHIPFPPVELFSWLPWRAEILRGLLGADVIGFQRKQDAESFLRAAARFTPARPREGGLEIEGRRVRVGAFPISIDVADFEATAGQPEVEAHARQIRERLGARKTILSVDRLDYTKGIDSRLSAFEDMLVRGVADVEDCVFVQIAVPSRESVKAYSELRDRVERLVGRINGQFSTPGAVAVHYFRRNLSKENLVAYYRAADVMLVTPLKDGMNLVAKEYVATRLDESGVLVLSEFAGAADELDSALIVNPYDVDGVSLALERALKLPEDEARRRMRSLRRALRRNDVYHWADAFLRALAGE